MSAEQLVQASRAELRRLRLIETERELAAEEADALTLTEEQRQTLLRPFAAVKAEFADLDGLRWTQTALRRRQPSHHQRRVPAPPHHHDQDPRIATPATANAFAVLTNADLAAFAPDDTIRAPHPPPRTRPRFPSPLIRGTTALPGDPPRDHHPRPPPAGHRDGTRTRSPVKGLFARDGDAEGGGWARESFLEGMEDGAEEEEEGQRPTPPGLTSYYSAAPAGARRGTAVTLLEPPAEQFTSSFPNVPSHASRSPFCHASSTSAHPSQPPSSLSFARSPTQHTPHTPSKTPFTSTSTSALSILTVPSSHPLPRRRASNHAPRPTRHAPSPPSATYTSSSSSSAHTTNAPDDDDDGDIIASPLLDAPPASSSSFLYTPSTMAPRTRPRPLSRAASCSVFPSSSTSSSTLSSGLSSSASPPAVSHALFSTSPPAVSSMHAHAHTTHPSQGQSPRARLAALLAHTPSTTNPTSVPSAPAPQVLRARSASSASASDTIRLKSGTVHLNSDTVRQKPAGLRGWPAPPPHDVGVNGGSDGGGGSGGGYASEDDEEATPRASPVEMPDEGGGGRALERGWIRGFA